MSPHNWSTVNLLGPLLVMELTWFPQRLPSLNQGKDEFTGWPVPPKAWQFLRISPTLLKFSRNSYEVVPQNKNYAFWPSNLSSLDSSLNHGSLKFRRYTNKPSINHWVFFFAVVVSWYSRREQKTMAQFSWASDDINSTLPQFFLFYSPIV